MMMMMMIIIYGTSYLLIFEFGLLVIFFNLMSPDKSPNLASG